MSGNCDPARRNPVTKDPARRNPVTKITHRSCAPRDASATKQLPDGYRDRPSAPEALRSMQSTGRSHPSGPRQEGDLARTRFDCSRLHSRAKGRTASAQPVMLALCRGPLGAQPPARWASLRGLCGPGATRADPLLRPCGRPIHQRHGQPTLMPSEGQVAGDISVPDGWRCRTTPARPSRWPFSGFVGRLSTSWRERGRSAVQACCDGWATEAGGRSSPPLAICLKNRCSTPRSRAARLQR
jgi:hypothetical protein